MPEPHADVFGDEQSDGLEPGTAEGSDENVGMLSGKGCAHNKWRQHPNDLDMDQPQEAESVCFRYTCCSLGICICILFSISIVALLSSETTPPDLGFEDVSFASGVAMGTEAAIGNTAPTLHIATSVITEPLAAESLTSLESTEKALSCMRLSDPQLEAKYPIDAETHFKDLFQNITSYVPMDYKPHSWAGYGGPWLENWWILNFTQKWFQRSEGTKLRDIFGPFIPIFVPWTDLAVRTNRYPNGMIEMMKEKMRKDVLYVTVSQHDLGVFAGAKHSRVNRKDFANLFVINSGGHGHVPLPLLKQPELPLEPVPMESRKYFVSFLGSSFTNRRVRETMKQMADKWSNKTHKAIYVKLKGEKQWKEIVKDSQATLSPRGFGRSSFRSGEMLQMGRVPVYLWNDVPWIFYRELWENEVIGFSTHFEKLDQALDHIAALGLDYLQTMEKRILSMRRSHFSYEGIMDQIAKYMTGHDGGSDLRCTKFPPQDFHHRRLKRNRRRSLWRFRGQRFRRPTHPKAS